MSDYVQLSETGLRSERLQVRRGAVVGVVYVERGVVVHAVFGSLAGRDAARAIFKHAEASAERLAFKEPAERTMAVRPSQLLLSFFLHNDELTRSDGMRRRSDAPFASASEPETAFGADPPSAPFELRTVSGGPAASVPKPTGLDPVAVSPAGAEGTGSADPASQSGRTPGGTSQSGRTPGSTSQSGRTPGSTSQSGRTPGGTSQSGRAPGGTSQSGRALGSASQAGRTLGNGKPTGRTRVSGGYSAYIAGSAARTSRSYDYAAPSRGDFGWLVRAIALGFIAGGISFAFFRSFRAEKEPTAPVVAPVIVEANSLTGLTDVMPRLIEAPAVKSPPGASALRPTVPCRVLVGPDGLVVEASVSAARTDLAAYEAEALTAVRKYRFKPAQRAGQVVSAWLTVPVSFAGTDRSAESVVLRGSRGLERLTRAIGEQFAIYSSGTTLTQTMDGAAPCVAELLENTADICLNTRPLAPSELDDAKVLGIELEEHLVGTAYAAIIVHPENPVHSLDLAQLAAVYSGQRKKWKPLGGDDLAIHLLGTPRDSLAADAVYDSALSANAATAEFSSRLKEVRDTDELIAQVASTPGAIAFAQTQDVAASRAAGKDSIKTLWVGATPGSATVPDEASIHNGRYPVSSQLRAYSRARRSESGQKLLEVILSVAGRRIAAVNDIAVGPRIRLPAPLPQAEAPYFEVFHVEFIAGSIGLDIPARLRLDQVALKLAQSEKRWAILIGHADPISERNQKDTLAQTRAEVAQRYLTAGGLGKGRVEIRSAGTSRPRSGAVDDLSQHRNRRVDIFVIER